MQNEEQNSIYEIVDGYIEDHVIARGNKAKSWEYGYNDKYDMVVISKDGTIGEIYKISNLLVALPAEPSKMHSRSKKISEQYWEPAEYPKELARIKSIFQWHEMSNEFKNQWVDYVETEFDRREQGFWFMNGGLPTYITGSHYMYLQWTKIDVGLPDFREANRIFFIFWEAVKADTRAFGMCYLKIRRSGFSFMGSSESVNIATMAKDARIGILSKTGGDAKKMFTDKVVPINSNLPFFFKPVMDGMDKPKTELAYRVPASKITKRNMSIAETEDVDGLNTTIDWKNTADNSYDGEKLQLLVHDECYAPDTKILCEGMEYRAISEIQIGDRVIVDGGALKTVVKKTEGLSKMYRVKQKMGIDYVVSHNHRLVLDQYMYNGRKKESKRKEVIMTPSEYLSLSKYKKQHTFSVKAKAIDGDDSGVVIPPYLLGVWLGDGTSASGSIIINKEKDSEILHYLGRMVDMHGIDYTIKGVDTSPSCVRFEMKGLKSDLKKLDLIKNKHIPKQYLEASLDAKLQLLAGIIDTDGYVDRKKGSIEIGMSRKYLVEEIRLLALSCGISCSSVKERDTNQGTKAYRLAMSGNLSSIPMLVERKRMDDHESGYSNRRNGVDVEYVGIGDYVGIQVDGETDDERRLILEDFTVSLNSGKWVKPDNILNNWRVTKTCLRLGSKIIGKCMMGSTSNALDKGGDNFKKLYYDSDVTKRSSNGQTKSGLYSLFIPMEWNFEGYIDIFGMPVLHTPDRPIRGIDGAMIRTGAIDYWENEVASLKSDPDALNEFYRQFPRTESHAFRDESKSSLFNLTKIYQQIDHNDASIKEHFITTGSFHWKDGVKDTKVVWTPDPRGRFRVSWLPPARLQNNVITRNGLFYPGNEHLGSFGCDPYDISGVVGGGGSNGSLHGMTKYHMDDAPVNEFFLEYVARPQTAEIFFEEVLMACVFYGMPVLAENNKPRLLYHFKNRGYRAFSMNRPDKPMANLSKTERELGGIPNSSEEVKQAHATAIESYIEKYVGIDSEGTYRDADEMGNMVFIRTLEDWARFDINNRTKFDATISSGLAIMANQKHMYQPEKKQTKISIKFAKYNNKGFNSELLNR